MLKLNCSSTLPIEKWKLLCLWSFPSNNHPAGIWLNKFFLYSLFIPDTGGIFFKKMFFLHLELEVLSLQQLCDQRNSSHEIVVNSDDNIPACRYVPGLVWSQSLVSHKETNSSGKRDWYQQNLRQMPPPSTTWEMMGRSQPWEGGNYSRWCHNCPGHFWDCFCWTGLFEKLCFFPIMWKHSWTMVVIVFPFFSLIAFSFLSFCFFSSLIDCHTSLTVASFNPKEDLTLHFAQS